MRYLLILIFLFYWVGTCQAAVPVTGRHQDMTFTSYEVNEYAAAAYFQKIANQSRAGLIDNDKSELNRVRTIASRLIAQAKRLKYECRTWDWEVHITDSDQVSAFSMAGGKILVGTRFIRKYNLSDSELAMVLAHEISHAMAEHVREQLSEIQLRRVRLPYTVEEASAEMNSDIGLYLSLMPLSRLQENEADHIGVYLLAAAGYPPEAAISFYRKLAHIDGKEEQSLFATHDSDANRLRAVRGYVEEVETHPVASVIPTLAHDFQ